MNAQDITVGTSTFRRLTEEKEPTNEMEKE